MYALDKELPCNIFLKFLKMCYICMYLLPLVDVKAVILQFLLQNIWDVDVNMDDLLLALPLHVNVRLNLLKRAQHKPLCTSSRETERGCGFQ